MSRKTSTAALDSFRHGSFHFRRRAPRHPAGESITRAFDYAAEESLLIRRPGLQLILSCEGLDPISAIFLPIKPLRFLVRPAAPRTVLAFQ
jgi:hypothetical protein